MSERAEDLDGFRGWLATEMRSRRMSVRMLAQRSGLNASTISRILNGERRPSLATAMTIARAVDADRLLSAALESASLGARTDPATQIERALRANGDLTDAQVQRLMSLYLAMRRAASATSDGKAPPVATGVADQ